LSDTWSSPRLAVEKRKTWMAATSAAMTKSVVGT
jgi:hypothetical protein